MFDDRMTMAGISKLNIQHFCLTHGPGQSVRCMFMARLGIQHRNGNIAPNKPDNIRAQALLAAMLPAGRYNPPWGQDDLFMMASSSHSAALNFGKILVRQVSALLSFMAYHYHPQNVKPGGTGCMESIQHKFM